jgi:hypothetical protein
VYTLLINNCLSLFEQRFSSRPLHTSCWRRSLAQTVYRLHDVAQVGTFRSPRYCGRRLFSDDINTSKWNELRDKIDRDAKEKEERDEKKREDEKRIAKEAEERAQRHKDMQENEKKEKASRDNQ